MPCGEQKEGTAAAQMGVAGKAVAVKALVEAARVRVGMAE